MSLEIYDSEENIPEALTEHYRKVEEGEQTLWIPDVRPKGDWALENVGALKRSKELASRERSEAKTKLRQYEEKLDGKSLDEYVDERLAEVKKGKNASESELQQLRESYDVRLRDKDQKIAALSGQVDRSTVIGALKSSLLQAGCHPDQVDNAARLMESQIELRKGDDGQEIVIYADEARTKRLESQEGNGFAGIDEFATHRLSTDLKVFRSQGKTGAGTEPQDSDPYKKSAAATNEDELEGMTPVQRMVAAREKLSSDG